MSFLNLANCKTKSKLIDFDFNLNKVTFKTEKDTKCFNSM